MPRGNPQNLIPAAHSLTVEEASKGGKKSAQRRKEKKAIKELLKDYLESPCEKTPALEELCRALGAKGSKSVKEIFIIKCLLNTLRKGDIEDIAKLQEIIGESESGDADGVQIIDDL